MDKNSKLVIKLGVVLCLAMHMMLGYSNHDAVAITTSSISIGVSPSIDLNVIPSATGPTAQQTVNLTVKTDNTDGFSIMLNSNDTTDLVNHLHPTQTIPVVTKQTTLANFPANSWGIYLGTSTPTTSTLFSGISISPQKLVENNVANASGTYKLAVAVKADTSLPAGTYRNDLVISVVAKAPDIKSLADITYMQDVTPEVCKNSKIWESEADSVTLIDKRDNKTYKVARLKDGNCWMQENLAFILSTDKPLTPEDSDVSETWTPVRNTATKMGSFNEDNFESWGPSTLIYYQWYAATAGTGIQAMTDGAEASGSICPKGWKLPLSGVMNNDNDGSFSKLLAAYGIAGKPDTAMLQPPLNFIHTNFVRGGDMMPVAFSVFGFYTSRVAQDATYRYELEHSSGGIYPSQHDRRSDGFTVRCVAVSAHD